MKPLIVGLEGLVLTANEIDFLKTQKPWGVIIFKRNCETPAQIRALTDSIKEIYNTEEVPILIDQEGGRVARLKGKDFRTYPSADFFYQIYQKDPEQALALVRLNASLQASELYHLGITVNCAPMIDVRHPSAHDIIGDRAFGENPADVALYGDAVIKGLMDQNILPIIKHMPGHGRSLCDSHHDLPIVDANWRELQQDFFPFKVLNRCPLAMTAHIRYTCLDDSLPATMSKDIIQQVIRGWLGFSGILMGDDISMQALKGNIADLALKSLEAGCDLVLHCNGQFDEMQAITDKIPEACPILGYRTQAMWQTLFEAASPRADDDLLMEYQELMMRHNVKVCKI